MIHKCLRCKCEFQGEVLKQIRDEKAVVPITHENIIVGVIFNGMKITYCKHCWVMAHSA